VLQSLLTDSLRRDMAVATVIDPRLKTLLFPSDCSKTRGVDAAVRAAVKIDSATNTSVATLATRTLPSDVDPVPSTSTSVAAVAKVEMSIWAKFDLSASVSDRSFTMWCSFGLLRCYLRREILSYLQELVINRDSSPLILHYI
jgi:hypothetical protein